MHFQYPIQRIRRLGGANSGGQDFVVAAAGPYIHIFAAATGSNLFSWPSKPDAASAPPPNGDIEHDASEPPPEKRRRLSSPGPEPAECSGTLESSQSTARGNTGPTEVQWQSIPILVVTASGSHIVAVTAEDKCIRVFEVAHDGKMSELSSRAMPKRPCAIALADVDSTILAADKFGDVYSLPFSVSNKPGPFSRNSPMAEEPKPFQPSASQLTVHTKRNLTALEQQMRYGANVSPKTGPTFERTLLLGHVSLLTDVVYVSLPHSTESSASRSYILTSDRDEHIRISRGPPQAYIIEGYCLGHTSFVSRLCVPEWDRRILVSGGGDDYILVWDWLQRRILKKATLDDISGGQEWKAASSTGDVAVAGIWSVPFGDDIDLRAEAPGAFLIAVEGEPKLLSFVYDSNGDLVHQPPIELSGNALDVTAIDNSGQILVSVDNVHEPGSTMTMKSSPSLPRHLLQAFKMSIGADGLKWDKVPRQAADTINDNGTTDITTVDDKKEASKQTRSLAESLYGLTNLRKKERETEMGDTM